MPNFTLLSDEQVLSYLHEHYAHIGAGEPPANLVADLLGAIQQDFVVIEKRDHAFAVVGRPNRKHPGIAGSLISIPPQADLIYLFVAPQARGKGNGRILLEQVKEKYMEDQSMELVCAGEKRKALFINAGFVAHSINPVGMHYMVCPPLPANK